MTMSQSMKLEHALKILEEHRNMIKDLRDKIDQAQMVDVTWLRVKYTYMLQDLNYRIHWLKGEIAEEQALERVEKLKEEKRNGSDAEERAAGSAERAGEAAVADEQAPDGTGADQGIRNPV